MKIIEAIEEKYNDLTKSEQRIASYYLENPKEATEKTLSEISTFTKCGEATVVRFCKKSGYDSFKNFQLNLALDLEKEHREKPGNFISDIVSNIESSITNTVEQLNLENLTKAIKLIDNAKTVYCIGVGSSGLSAEICSMRFIRNGQLSYCIKDSHFQSMLMNHLNAEDVLIAFSASGKSMDTINCVKIAKQYNTPVVAITNSTVSPLAQISNIVLVSTRRHNPLTAGNLILQINQIFIADILTTGCSLLHEEDTLSMKEKTYNSVKDKLY
ncbi:MAG: MurR/RpiR family transcriptional regulator [Bacilli bacterium]